MTEDVGTRVTRILGEVQAGNMEAADELLPLVYAELRRLARSRMAREKHAHSVQPTSLVHQAYLRLLGDQQPHWEGRGHFFAAAAEAMRRILVEAARQKQRRKHGGDLCRKELIPEAIALPVPSEEILAVHEALGRLEATNHRASELVKLRYFAGFTIPEAAERMGISSRKASQIWTYARAWLATEIAGKPSD